MEVTKHQPGMFCWANYPTLELDKAQDFYASLLKLDATPNEIDPGTTYVVLNRAGSTAAPFTRWTRRRCRNGEAPGG